MRATAAGPGSRSAATTPAPCRASAATTARPMSARSLPSPPGRAASCPSPTLATAGSTGTNPAKPRRAAGSGRLGGDALGRDADDVPDRPGLLQAVDHQRRDVDLVPAQAVGGGGGEGVVAVVEGLTEG